MTASTSSLLRSSGELVVPEPVSRFLNHAGLDARAVRAGIRLDTDRTSDSKKTLLSYSTVSQLELGLFRTDSGRERPPPFESAVGAGDAVVSEPDHPWWGPKDARRAVHYAYATAHYDFVEVWIEPGFGRVHVRAFS